MDNASTDGSATYVKRTFPNVLVVQNKNNVGFAQGHDAGLQAAKGKFVLLLNPDTTVESDFLDFLVQSIQHDESIGVVQPKVLFGFGKRQN